MIKIEECSCKLNKGKCKDMRAVTEREREVAPLDGKLLC